VPGEFERTPPNNIPVARIETHDPPIAFAARPIAIKGAIAINGLNATVAATVDNPGAVAAGNIAAAAGPMTAVGSAVRIILPIDVIPIIRIVVVAGNSRTKVEYARCGGIVASNDHNAYGSAMLISNSVGGQWRPRSLKAPKEFALHPGAFIDSGRPASRAICVCCTFLQKASLPADSVKPVQAVASRIL
jgi:hypothetical protein